MPLLYYWRRDDYLRDLDVGAAYHLNQGTKRLHQIDLGESLWAFTRRADGVYALAAELRIRARTINDGGFAYGPYRVWGDLAQSRYFLVESGPDAEPLLRGLSIAPASKHLGQSFQGHAAVRKVTAVDHDRLAAFAEGLLLEPRARLIDELGLEQAVGDSPDAVERLLSNSAPGFDEARVRELVREITARNRAHVGALRDLYANRCQLCGDLAGAAFERTVAEAHHLMWLSRGGPDRLVNMALLCPNDHRSVHASDAVFDYADHAFVFDGRREPLRLNRHLPAGA